MSADMRDHYSMITITAVVIFGVTFKEFCILASGDAVKGTYTKVLEIWSWCRSDRQSAWRTSGTFC